MSELGEVDASRAEAERVASDMLPLTIKTVGGISAAAGLLAIGMALGGVAPWLLTAGVSSLLAAPFLYGFADIVISLRRLCAKA